MISNRRTSISSQLVLLLCVTLLFACKSETSESSSTTSKSKSELSESKNTTPKKYRLTAFSPSQAYPDAEITSMKYENGKFSFGIADGAYKLGQQTPDAPQKNCANSGQGQHIHLIPDNMPYAAKYTPDFEYELLDGQHFILAFLSRSYHESIKTDKAHVIYDTEVKNKTITSSTEVTKPMLFYSRPKGIYEGSDTKRVMLDYYIVNADATTYRVEADINGEKHILDKWQPYYIEGLPAGENIITLTLLDKNGKRIRTDLNPVTRKFRLNPDPAVN